MSRRNVAARCGVILIALVMTACLAACSAHELWPSAAQHDEVGVAVAPVSIAGNDTSRAGPATAVSGGSNTTGVTVPTVTAVVGRLQNGLEQNALSTSGNFAKASAQVNTNLPKVTNVNSAAGYDQIQLLVYAACSDLVNNGSMQNVYKVPPGSTVTANQAALVAAGMRMLDQHTAGIASGGPDTAAITAVLTNLVQTEAGVGANTSTMVFMTVCIAANSAGITLLGM